MVSRRSVDDPLPTPPPPPPPPPTALAEIAFEEANGDASGNGVPSLAKSVKEQGSHSYLEFYCKPQIRTNNLRLRKHVLQGHLNTTRQVSSLEARGRRQQKKGATGMGNGSNSRRSKSENPLQRKLSVAQHLSLTTRPQVSLHFTTILVNIFSRIFVKCFICLSGETPKRPGEGFPFAAANAGKDEDTPEKWRRLL